MAGDIENPIIFVNGIVDDSETHLLMVSLAICREIMFSGYKFAIPFEKVDGETPIFAVVAGDGFAGGHDKSPVMKKERRK